MYVRSNREVANDDDFAYDVFVAYSHHDCDWVVGDLYRYLHKRLQKRVCIHHKDFKVGEYITDEILRCIDASKKIVFVITRHFLTSEWMNYELEMAILHVSRRGRPGLVIVMKDRIAEDAMPRVLRRLWWGVVCLEWNCGDGLWGENMFWDKLKNAVE